MIYGFRRSRQAKTGVKRASGLRKCWLDTNKGRLKSEGFL